MTNFTWVDYIIVGILLLSVIAGLLRGLMRELISLITLVVAFVLATLFSGKLAAMFTSSDSMQGTLSSAPQAASYVSVGISFIVIFLGVMIIGRLFGYLASSAVGEFGFFNRLLGAVFGLARGILFTVVLIFVVQLTPFVSQPAWSDSQLIPQFHPAVQWMSEKAAPGMEALSSRVGNSFQNINEMYLQGVEEVKQSGSE